MTTQHDVNLGTHGRLDSYTLCAFVFRSPQDMTKLLTVRWLLLMLPLLMAVMAITLSVYATTDATMLSFHSVIMAHSDSGMVPKCLASKRQCQRSAQ